jgi:effector-binding domain-containing protein
MQTAEYVCQVQDIPARPTLSVRRVAAVQELPQAMGSAYGAVMAYAGAQGIPVEGPAYVIYYNMDMSALDMEIGFFSPQELPTAGEDVQSGHFPAGRWATVEHVGPYDGLKDAYAALEAWVAAHGFTPTGLACEFYFNGPDEASPSEYRTQAMFMLA